MKTIFYRKGRCIKSACALCAFLFFLTLQSFADEVTLSRTIYGTLSYDSSSTVTLSNVTISSSSGTSAALAFNADSTLIIADDTENTISSTAKSAIYIKEGCTLTIQGGEKGNGKLTCNGGTYGAGIGAFQGANAGNIIIEGGMIDARPNQYGAAIGGGYGVQNNHANVSNITIRGGTITATANSTGTGAGIGSGYSLATCGDIEILGGTITATGAKYSAGIGATGSSRNSRCGNINISGGSITAYGGSNAAAIGGAYSNCGTITISGSDVNITATKDTGAAEIIGRGDTSIGSVSVDIDEALTKTYSQDGRTIVITSPETLTITSAKFSMAGADATMHLECLANISQSRLKSMNKSQVQIKRSTSLNTLDSAEPSSEGISSVEIDSSTGEIAFDLSTAFPDDETTLFIRVVISD